MANIPIADKHKDTATNQHLVPRCYMREWAYNLILSIMFYTFNSYRLDNYAAIGKAA